MKVLCALALLMAGSLASFYAGFCLLGGPDAAILSRSSFLFGIPSLAVAVLLIFTATRLLPAKGYVYAPALAAPTAWLAALAVSQKVGFYIWLFATPAALILSVAYLIVAQVLSAVQPASPNTPPK